MSEEKLHAFNRSNMVKFVKAALKASTFKSANPISKQKKLTICKQLRCSLYYYLI